MQSNLQCAIDQQREVYSHLRFPLLQQLCRIHSLTVRDVATIFGIGKSHAQEIITHQKAPSLELAFRLARYFECSVDELFGWRFDDSGERRPLVIELSNKVLVRLGSARKSDQALELVKAVAEDFRMRKEQRMEAESAASGN